MHAYVKKRLTSENYLVYFFVKEGIGMTKFQGIIIGLMVALIEIAAFIPFWWLLAPVHVYFKVLFSIIVPPILLVANVACTFIATQFDSEGSIKKGEK